MSGPRWRVGEKNRNALVRDGRARGMVDHPALAAEIIERMNAQPSAVVECAALSNIHRAFEVVGCTRYFRATLHASPQGDARVDGHGPTPEAACAGLLAKVRAAG